MSVGLDIVGGIGLFLLGIMLFMDSLRSIASDALRRGLSRFTQTPLRAMLTGMGTTTFIQSANAIIVIAMGLAGAGILSSVQAIAILIGANIGTTGTAWLVALLGLRFGFGPVATVLVAGGALTRLLAKGRAGTWGQIVSGFGLLFVGIDLLAQGMGGLDLDLTGPLQGQSRIITALALIAVGAVTTALTQSSSVTVATTITAVFAGAIPLQDAAWLVIGQNLGTTSTLALVAIGATAPGRRLAAAHAIINGSTAIVVIAAFRPILWATSGAVHAVGGDDALALAAFHTVFNVIGALVWMPVLPFLDRRLRVWIPDRGPRLTASLDPVAAQVPGVAVESARRATAEIASETCSIISARLMHGNLPRGSRARLEAVQRAMIQLREFLTKVQSGPQDGQTHHVHIDVVHAVERLEHLVEACTQGSLRAETLHSAGMAPAMESFSGALKRVQEWLHGPMEVVPDELMQDLDAVEARRDADRGRMLEDAATGGAVLPDAMAQMEALAWITRQAHYLSRLVDLLALEVDTTGSSESRVSEVAVSAQ